MEGVSTKLAVLEERLSNLEHRFDEHERRQNGSMNKIDQKLEQINAKIDGRPSWTVVFLLSCLSSITVGLIVAAVKGG